MDVSIPLLVVVLFSFVFIVLSGLSIFLGLYAWDWWKKDKAIFFDKNNRWSIKHTKLKNKDMLYNKGGAYEIIDETTYLNEKGLALSIWFWNKSNPLKIHANKSSYIDSKTLKAILQNEQVRKIVTPKNPALDTLILIGSICAIIAALLGILIALNQFGVIKSG